MIKQNKIKDQQGTYKIFPRPFLKPKLFSRIIFTNINHGKQLNIIKLEHVSYIKKILIWSVS